MSKKGDEGERDQEMDQEGRYGSRERERWREVMEMEGRRDGERERRCRGRREGEIEQGDGDGGEEKGRDGEVLEMEGEEIGRDGEK